MNIWEEFVDDLFFCTVVFVAVCTGGIAAVGYGFLFASDFDLAAPLQQNVLLDGFFRRTMECIGIFISCTIASVRFLLLLLSVKERAIRWHRKYGWLGVMVQVLTAAMMLAFVVVSIMAQKPLQLAEFIGIALSLVMLVWSFFDFLRWYSAE